MVEKKLKVSLEERLAKQVVIKHPFLKWVGMESSVLHPSENDALEWAKGKGLDIQSVTILPASDIYGISYRVRGGLRGSLKWGKSINLKEGCISKEMAIQYFLQDMCLGPEDRKELIQEKRAWEGRIAQTNLKIRKFNADSLAMAKDLNKLLEEKD